MHGGSPGDESRYRGQGEGDAWELPASKDPDVLAAELSSRFRDRLRFFAARRLRDRDAAEDVAQEVLRRTLEALRAGRVENLAALPAFLFQTARHICMHHGRSAQRQAHAMERSVDPGDPAERPDTYDPVAALIDEERRSMVRKAMAVLGDADREILRLSFMDGLDAEAIGIRLGITPGAVRVRRHRAVTRLAEKLPVTERPERGR